VTLVAKKPASKKTETIESLTHLLDKAAIALVVNYRGMSVAELTQLRRELRQNQARFTVAKNTLARRSVANKPGASDFMPSLKGPTALLVGMGDQVAPLKTYKKFLKDIKKDKQFEIRAGWLDGQALSAEDVDRLAELPPLEELRAQLLGGIASPLNGLVAALSGPQRSLVNVLDQYAKTLQAA
jgi:large subunit ribosomal protein L10